MDQPKGIEVVKEAICKLKFNQQLKKSEGTKTPKVELTISIDGVAIQEPKTKTTPKVSAIRRRENNFYEDNFLPYSKVRLFRCGLIEGYSCSELCTSIHYIESRTVPTTKGRRSSSVSSRRKRTRRGIHASFSSATN